MQLGRGNVRPPIGVAFEGDLGHRIDAVLAVALLQGMATRGLARSVAVCVSRTSVKAAQLADVIGGFYTPRAVGGFGLIGMPEGASEAENPPLAAVLSRAQPDGTPVYSSNLKRLLDTADNAVHIRNILLAQNDQNAAIVVAGPMSGLARLVALYGARPQIATKAKHLVLAAGSFGAGAPDPAIRADIAAARKVFAEWPTPIVVAGTEVGEALSFPGASIDRDFGWTNAHPVVDAYRAFKTMPYDAPAPALAAMLYAVQPDEGFFALSDPGTISVGDDGRLSFVPGAGGRHRHLVVDPAQQARVAKAYTDFVSAQPNRAAGRGRGAGPGQAPPPPPAQQAPATPAPQPPAGQVNPVVPGPVRQPVP